jgi:type II secretory pathway pseudopilin PulG
MIEIVISLAVIGFALVAIIGILPTGMNVQRDNRQETIINQDANVLMNAVRNGERGLNDLTNYVESITTYSYLYRANGGVTASSNYYTPTVCRTNGVAAPFPLTNGYYIVGLLGTPKYTQIFYNPRGQLLSFVSNHTVAVFRSLSGPASEKPPQSNPIIQDLAMKYKLITDVGLYGTNFYSPAWTNFGDPLIAGNTNEQNNRRGFFAQVKYFETNLHDVRLTFRWPVLPNGNSGPSRQVFRTMVSGPYTNDPPGSPFFFFQPNFYYRGS